MGQKSLKSDTESIKFPCYRLYTETNYYPLNGINRNR